MWLSHTGWAPGPGRLWVSVVGGSGGGAGAGLLGSGAFDKDLQGLGVPGRCDKVAGGRADRWVLLRLEAPVRPPRTWSGDQTGIRGVRLCHARLPPGPEPLKWRRR